MKNIKPSKGLDGLTSFGSSKGSTGHLPSGKPMDSGSTQSEKAPGPKMSATIGGGIPSLDRGKINTSEDGSYADKPLSHPKPSEAMKTHRE